MGEEQQYYDLSYYDQVAAQERQRLWNIAKAYMQTPSIPNIISALGAMWNSLPINTNGLSVNPNINVGHAPSANGPIKGLSTFQKLSAAGKILNAKSLITRRANAAARKAAERQAAYLAWEQEGNNAARVYKTTENYVLNEAERAAAIDFLKENPGMKGSVDTNVMDKYSSDHYMYPWNPRFAKLLPTRKSLKETRANLNMILRNIQ